MTSAPTDLDFVASILALIILVVSVLTLFGMGILMAVGAVFSNRPLVTSWPADQEHSFTAYEHRSTKASSQAWVLSFIGAIFVAVFATGVYFSVEPDMRDITKDMNMSNLTKRRAPPPPKQDSVAPAEAPKPDTPAPDSTAPPAPKP